MAFGTPAESSAPVRGQKMDGNQARGLAAMRRRRIGRARACRELRPRQDFLLGQGLAPPRPTTTFTSGKPGPHTRALRPSPQAGENSETPKPLLSRGRVGVRGEVGSAGRAGLRSEPPEGGAARVPRLSIHYSGCLLSRGKEREGEGIRAEGRRGRGTNPGGTPFPETS